MIGGAQGSGVDSSANIFSRACALGGLWIYGTREYYSNIKGLHSYFQVRVTDSIRRSGVDNVDLLATFDAETIIRHAEIVRPDGGIIYNSSLTRTEIDKVDTIEDTVVSRIQSRLERQGLPKNVDGLLQEAASRGVRIFPIPYDELITETAQKLGETQLSKVSKIVNVLAVSVSLSLLGLEENCLEQALTKTFADKKKIIGMNSIGAKLAYEHVTSQFKDHFGFQLLPIDNDPKLLLAGSEAVALGKIVGGVRFQTYYPITPASDESEFLESHEVFDLLGSKDTNNQGSILVVQTEDEIAAITMATGAALTGVRASTSTSGPGFCLMVEGMGWAGMNEVPIVITLYSRGGPSTGMPTRNEQGDLKFAISAGHGEFPRIVLCSGDLEECFYDAIRASNYAEMFQTPVIHLVNKGMANSSATLLPPNPSLISLERGKLITDASAKQPGDKYKRFAFVEDGISPRAVLGMKGYTFWNTGDEHNEIGHIDEDPDNRIKMMTKRMTKLDTAEKAIPDDVKLNFFPSKKSRADVTLVSWGSPKGAILDAIEQLRADGIDPEFLQIRLASPFPTELVKKRLSNASMIIDIEQNYSGQMASLIAEKTLIDIQHKILKFNGRSISQDEIYQSVRNVYSKSESTERVILVHGA
jgi:2-oxoglutarate ferredoxin oxidoreductase subunit alpha